MIGAGGSFLQAYSGRAVGNPAGTAGFEPNAMPSYYPPTLTGMRGSHDGSYEVAHALAWQEQKPKTYETLDEHYDLVVVGAGMSGCTPSTPMEQI